MKNLILITVFIFSYNSHSMDDASVEALQKTQEMLRNPTKRMNAVNSSEKGRAAHEKVKNLFQTSGNIDNAYEMAAQMMETVAKKSGGDSKKMQQLLQQGLSDPASFAESMSPEFKKMLRSTASDVESFKNPNRN